MNSLVNDATAIVAYRYAVAAVLSGTFFFWQAAFQFILVAFGGIILGCLIAQFLVWIFKRFSLNPNVVTISTLLLPFISYVIAERLHISGVLAAVSAGLYISWREHEIFSFRTRMQMNSFWETLIFLLNGLVFILIGLQLPQIIRDDNNHSLGEMINYGLIVSGAVIVIRLIWIFPMAYVANWFYRRRAKPHNILNSKYLFVLGWAGMRGVVSLATALALPLTLENGTDFPERNTILFITFVVILVTLVIQGLSLPALIRFLKISEPWDKDKADERAIRLSLANAAHKFIREELTGRMHHKALDNVKNRLERQISYLNGILRTEEASISNDDEENGPFFDYLQSEQEIIDHQRRIMIEMHKKGTYSAEALKKIEQDLDARSLTLDSRRKSL